MARYIRWMQTRYAILFTALLSGILFTSVCVYGKEKIVNKHRKTTIGIQTGRDVIFTDQKSNLPKFKYSTTTSLIIKKNIAEHFKVETGINYTGLFGRTQPQGPASLLTNMEPYRISLPVSIQYYVLPEKCKAQPYCGIGLQVDHNLTQKLRANQLTDAQTNVFVNTPPQPGNKSISILFTQGFTYEVNTKIQVTESVHFITNNWDNTLGINIGIGYHLP
jgi:outer membrane protein W